MRSQIGGRVRAGAWCVCACAAALPLAACGSGSGGNARSKSVPASGPSSAQAAGGGGSVGAATPVAKPQPMNRAERTELREQALSLISNAALAGKPEERANAIEALTLTPSRLPPALDAGLADPNAGVRAVAAMAVGKAKQKEFVPKVRPLLTDDSPFVQSAALFALRRNGAEVDLTPLGQMLFDPSPNVRAQAAFIMGMLGEKSALGPLREAAKDSMSRANAGKVKIMDLQIAEARVKLGDEAALADIRTALFPSRPEDLEAAVFAMQISGELKDRASINRLIQFTSPFDESKQPWPGEVRMAAAMALAKMGQTEGSYIAREYFAGEKESLRAQSAHLFGFTGRPENLPILQRMMNDPDGRVRVAAAASIVRITGSGGGD